MEYYYTDVANQTKGPVTIDHLRALASSGAIDSSCMVAAAGSQHWVPVGTIIPVIVPAHSRTEPLAIWSFVLSLIGLLCCGFIVGIPAIICGHLAISSIKNKPYLGGKGLAIAGLVIGYIATFFWLIYLIFFGGMAVLESLTQGSAK